MSKTVVCDGWTLALERMKRKILAKMMWMKKSSHYKRFCCCFDSEFLHFFKGDTYRLLAACINVLKNGFSLILRKFASLRFNKTLQSPKISSKSIVEQTSPRTNKATGLNMTAKYKITTMCRSQVSES